MAGFDAGSAVDPMDYDFTTVKGGQGKGTVPEPSTADMKAFQRDFANIQRRAMALEPEDEKSVGKLSADEMKDLQDKMEALGEEMDVCIASLCQNTPSVEDVSTLPFRVKTAFAKWLLEQFDPNSEASGMKK